MSDVKLSQPKSARTINNARILGCLRTHDNVSKAEIARILDLNKVSTGEIVDDLIEQGRVRESGKMESSNGRRPTCLEIVYDAKYVLAVDIGSKFITVALCDMLGQVKHFERIPTNTSVKKVEEFIADLIKSCIRVTRLVESSKIIGAGVAVGGKVSPDGSEIVSCSYLPWKNIPIAQAFEQIMKIKAVACNSTCALVAAERITNPEADLLASEDPIIYIEWGDSVSMVQVYEGKAFGTDNNFAHLKVANTGLCTCGQIGCLASIASAWAIGGNNDVHLRDLWEKVGSEVINAMASAINTVCQITGSKKAIISGEGATITDACLKALQKACPNVQVAKSNLGDKANLTSAAELALDRWVYMSSMLEKVKNWL